MNMPGEEENKRKTLRKHEEKQENQESTELKNLTARNSLAVVRLFKGSRKKENYKGPLM